MGTRGPAIDERQPSGAAPKPTGFARVLHNLVHRRRRYRQAVGIALAFLFTFAGTPEPLTLSCGAAVTGLGMLVRLWASGHVMKNEVLATTGPYGYVRHPLYVGNLLICIGLCLASDDYDVSRLNHNVLLDDNEAAVRSVHLPLPEIEQLPALTGG